jgi:hypothetical protein
MKANGSTNGRRIVTILLPGLAVAALATMGAISLESGSVGVGHAPAIVADSNTVTSAVPPSTPAIAKAGPVVKPTTFAGGDWPGMGSMGEDWGK